MSPRYFREPLAVIAQGERDSALNRRRPAWGVLNRTALQILDAVGPHGSTPLEVAERCRTALGDPEALEDDVSVTLAALSRAGLVSTAPAEPTEAAPSASDYRVDHLYIELAARCNLRCLHCYMEGAPERTEALSVDEVRSLLGQFSDAGGSFVTLSGGEPLLYPGLEAAVSEVSARGLRGTLITNGVPFRDRHARLLDANGFQIAISLDGVTPAVNDRVRGLGTHGKILTAIDLALEVFGPDRFILSFTPTKISLGDVPKLFAFAMERGIRRLNISLLEGVGRARDSRDEMMLSLEERTRLVEVLFEGALASLGRLEVDLNDTRNILDIFRTDRAVSERHPLWRGVRIDSSGDAYPSTFGSAREFHLGNVRSAPLGAILESPILRRLYLELHDRFLRTRECRDCAWGQLCRGGGATSAYYATGNLLSPDTYCAGYLAVFGRIALALADLPLSEGPP
jgi:radical SAM protein with 4Fe4S-binding SPASM domain